MPPPRKDIRERFAERLDGLATTGDRVFTTRVYPTEQVPALAIYTAQERIGHETLGMLQKRHLQVVVEIYAKATGDVDDVLDQAQAEVETALVGTDTTLGGMVTYCAYTGCDEEIEINQQLERIAAVRRLQWEVKYAVQADNPGVFAYS